MGSAADAGLATITSFQSQDTASMDLERALASKGGYDESVLQGLYGKKRNQEPLFIFFLTPSRAWFDGEPISTDTGHRSGRRQHFIEPNPCASPQWR